MDRQSYSIRFHNDCCIESFLPEGVTYENHLLKFQNKEPIELTIHFQLDRDFQFQIRYVFEKNVNVHLIETKSLQDHATLEKKVDVLDNANVHVFNENTSINEAVTQCQERIYLATHSFYQCGYAELSDGSITSDFSYYLNGENADAKVRMAILSKEQDKKKYQVLIQHNQPHTYGQMDNYGVVKDQAQLVIDGIGTITKGQHGSASHQTNKIMVFDTDCIASANPYLYIDEYDVKASHAAAVGKMDEEHLYYLQSRGLTKKQAMQLITYGYLKPVIEVVDNKLLKEHFEEVLSKVGA